ncbi:GNAT family N-acetyltransferase [Sinorhizobium meliloti]|uniref:GNAT family N-acetyltransferase n=1 Tax=Rhizobium meliloti TaxID=382 RepID=UPI0020908A97|nr:GNAT family N-acetyltransferase [Sinorhizobium meliloti]MCO5963881.1 GNAT family N-acetyltransferase [Sinorhizobium meliloti]
MFTLRAAKDKDLARNFKIWCTSVLATHHFLSTEDFGNISELVEKSYLLCADLIVAVDADDLSHGFMGATGDHVDALFVHAASRGQGIGRLLLDSFLATRNEATVDVNRTSPEEASTKLWGSSRKDDRTLIQRVAHIRCSTCAGGECNQIGMT